MHMCACTHTEEHHLDFEIKLGNKSNEDPSHVISPFWSEDSGGMWTFAMASCVWKMKKKCKSLICLEFTSLNTYFSPPKEHTLYIESVHPHCRVHQYQIQNPVKRADDHKMDNTWLLTSWWQSTSQQNPEPFFSTRQNRTVTGSSTEHTPTAHVHWWLKTLGQLNLFSL